MSATETTEDVPSFVRRGFILSLVIGTIFLLILIVFASAHFEETEELLLIIQKAGPLWLLFAALAQVATYICAGLVWYIIVKPTKHHLSMKSLTGLAVEQLSVNQLIPVGGLAGNVIIVKAMRRLGLPNALAVEVLFIDMLSYYIAFSSATFIALVILTLLKSSISPIVLTLVVIFFSIELTAVTIIWTVVNHKKLSLPQWLIKIEIVQNILAAIEEVSSKRVFSPKLLLQTGSLRFAIFVLDALTLFAVMRATNAHGTIITAFVALVIASVAGALTLLPGGIGGFEAGSIAILATLGVPVDIAIASTILLRGLTLWIPLIPGLYIAREDLGLVRR